MNAITDGIHPIARRMNAIGGRIHVVFGRMNAIADGFDARRELSRSSVTATA